MAATACSKALSELERVELSEALEDHLEGGAVGSPRGHPVLAASALPGETVGNRRAGNAWSSWVATASVCLLMDVTEEEGT